MILPINPTKVIDDRLLVIGHRGTRHAVKRHRLQRRNRPFRPQSALKVGKQVSRRARSSDLVETERQAKRYSCRIDRNEPVFARAKQQRVSAKVGCEPFAEPAKIFQHSVEWMAGGDTSTPPQPNHLAGLDRRQALKRLKGFLLFVQRTLPFPCAASHVSWIWRLAAGSQFIQRRQPPAAIEFLASWRCSRRPGGD